MRAGATRQRLLRRHDRPGLRGRADGDGVGLGHRRLVRRDRRLDPARERAAPGRARGRDPPARDDGRLRQHPRPERARARWTSSRRRSPSRPSSSAGSRRRSGRTSRRTRERAGCRTATGQLSPAGLMQKHPRRHRARRQQDAEPRDPVRLAVRARDRRLGRSSPGPTSRSRTRSSSRRRSRSRRSSRAAPRSPPAAFRMHPSRRATTRSSRRRRRSRASSRPTGSGSCSPRSSPTSGTSRQSRSSSW